VAPSKKHVDEPLFWIVALPVVPQPATQMPSIPLVSVIAVMTAFEFDPVDGKNPMTIAP
jgi:hypothetical protein